MTEPLFDIPAPPLVPIAGDTRGYPVRRIFCVGRNYAAHAAEMGNEVDRAAPFYFTKSAHALCLSGATIPYPPGTRDCHHEMEFVVALGADAFEVSEADAMAAVWGYGCGIDRHGATCRARPRKSGVPGTWARISRTPPSWAR